MNDRFRQRGVRLAVMVAAALALPVLTGCPSLSTLQTPATVPEGDFRFAIGLEAVGVVSGGASGTAPQAEFAARYGVSDNIDIGAKVYGLGAELGLKWQFLRGGFDAAVAPAVSFISISSTGASGESASISVFYFHLPLLFGANLSDSFTLAFGPKFLYGLFLGDVSTSSGDEFASGDVLMGGLYLGLPIRVGGAFWVAPEINVYTPFVAEGDAAFDSVWWQGGIGLYFGGAPRTETEPAGGQPAPPYGPPPAGPPPAGPPPGGPGAAPPPPPPGY